MSTTELTGYGEGRQSNRGTYGYDPLGQLIRAYDPFDPTAGVKGTTWAYSYDQGGNILSKMAYHFTEEETISEIAVHTDIYKYENSGWKDQLTAYNDVPIMYDAIGNPLNDREWTYTWQHGRQLASMSKDDETVSFVYSEDGLRVQKTSTSTGTTKYTLHGKNIVHLTNGIDELHFFYDAQGRVAVVDYNGESYRYMHNLQGDVIALVDEIGNKVVEYWYDAWGKPTGKNGTMAETLGKVQPFRYRGCLWDEETELYYLRSRYYMVQWSRFANADTVMEWNLFTYCKNNPLKHSDYTGRISEKSQTAVQNLIDMVLYIYDALVSTVYLAMIYSEIDIKPSAKQLRIPNNTVASKKYFELVSYSKSSYFDNRYWAMDMAELAIRKYKHVTQNDYSFDTGIPPEKVAFEIRVHAQLYLVGMFTDHTDITDVSPYEGQGWVIHVQDIIDWLYEII